MSFSLKVFVIFRSPLICAFRDIFYCICDHVWSVIECHVNYVMFRTGTMWSEACNCVCVFFFCFSTLCLWFKRQHWFEDVTPCLSVVTCQPISTSNNTIKTLPQFLYIARSRILRQLAAVYRNCFRRKQKRRKKFKGKEPFIAFICKYLRSVQCVSNRVSRNARVRRRGVKSFEKRKCVISDEFFWLSKICVYECKWKTSFNCGVFKCYPLKKYFSVSVECVIFIV